MKNLILLIGFLTIFNSYAQQKELIKYVDTLVTLVKENKISELATRVNYPLKRPNPIPDLINQQDFIRYYEIMFDSIFREKIIYKAKLDTFTNWRGSMILNGMIWLDYDGNIISINNNSKAEEQLRKRLSLEKKNKMHVSVGEWEMNYFSCKCGNFLIRVDKMKDDELRYLSWSNPKSIYDKPDLQLIGAKIENQGTGGGSKFTFDNSDWKYQVDLSLMGESDDQIGTFLVLFKNKEEKRRIKCINQK